jgi:hypothetical protein
MIICAYRSSASAELSSTAGSGGDQVDTPGGDVEADWRRPPGPDFCIEVRIRRVSPVKARGADVNSRLANLPGRVLIFAFAFGLAITACASPNRIGGAPIAEPVAQTSPPSPSASAGEPSTVAEPGDAEESGQASSSLEAGASGPGSGPAPGSTRGPEPAPPAGSAASPDRVVAQGSSTTPARIERPPSPVEKPGSDHQQQPAIVKTDDPVTRIGGAPEGVSESDQLGGATFATYRASQEEICKAEIGRADCVKLVQIPADAPSTFFACSAEPAPAFEKKIPVGTTIMVTMKPNCFGDSAGDGSSG